jgi:hypothetical protein
MGIGKFQPLGGSWSARSTALPLRLITVERETSRRSKRMKHKIFDLLPLLLTVVIAVAACFSSYYSYQAVRIASEARNIQSRQEIVGYSMENKRKCGPRRMVY